MRSELKKYLPRETRFILAFQFEGGFPLDVLQKGDQVVSAEGGCEIRFSGPPMSPVAAVKVKYGQWVVRDHGLKVMSDQDFRRVYEPADGRPHE